MTNCVTPPPRLPHPAAVALAVPTQLAANIRDVWYCVMTNEAPMAPINTRKIRNVVKSFAKPIVITGSDPNKSSHVYVSRGPMRSHSHPTISRANAVTATDPMMHQPTWSLVSRNSSRTTAISGAMPNQAKKHK
jgi:hypothetical protein